MLDGERRDRMLDVLRRDLYASVHALAGETGASETTIRRDLALLESEGRLVRLHGGAELATELRSTTKPPREEPFETRRIVRSEEKRRIAKAAVTLCEDGETIFVDGGSTTYRMVEYLRARTLTIVTNSFAIAEELLQSRDTTVIIPGGIVYRDSRLILDPFGDQTFRNYLATTAFMGVGGITESGALNNDSLLIRTERAMVEHSSRLIVMADSSKLGRTAPMRLCGLEAIDTLITDGDPEPELEKKLLSADVSIIRV